MNRNTNILSPDRSPRVTPSPRSLSLTAPAVTTQHVAQQMSGPPVPASQTAVQVLLVEQDT